MISFFMLIVTYVSTSAQVIDSPLPLEKIILGLKIGLRNAEIAYENDSVKLKTIMKLRGSTNEFVNVISKSDIVPDTTFLKALSSDMSLINSLAVDSSNSIKKLEYLIKSFALKNKHGKNFGFHNNIGNNEIVVNIRLVKNTIDLKGYDIACNTMFWFNKNPLKYAPDAKSPTSILLPAGKYMFYIKKGSYLIKSYERTVGDGNGRSDSFTFSLD